MLGFIKETSNDGDVRVTKIKQFGFLPLLLISVALSGIVIWMSSKDFLIWKGEEPEIAPWRKKKLQQELKEINNAEQYALIVRKSGTFPCFSCVEKIKIYLNVGEIWRYGVTKKGQKGRYSRGLPEPNLEYVVQFEGPIDECLKEEKIKIYNYALLPENLKRTIPLIRPPGNKRDD
jgi:hypothetical protein